MVHRAPRPVIRRWNACSTCRRLSLYAAAPLSFTSQSSLGVYLMARHAPVV